MNTTDPIPNLNAAPAAHRVEFFRLPAPGKRDPYFGLSRGWYYKAAALGEIRMVSIRQRGALRGVRLIAYDSVVAYIRRSEKAGRQRNDNAATGQQQPVEHRQSCLVLETDGPRDTL